MDAKNRISRLFHKPASGSGLTAVLGFAFIILIAATLAACSGPSTGEAAARTTNVPDGAALFENLGCIGCHEVDGKGRGPALVGLSGQTILLDNGQVVNVDEQYVRTAILEPSAQVHTGYSPIMPSYEGRISDEELSTLVNYLLSENGGN